MTWEKIDDSSLVTQRAKIPGGWLVRFWEIDKFSAAGSLSGMTFVPDPLHAWDGESLD